MGSRLDDSDSVDTISTERTAPRDSLAEIRAQLYVVLACDEPTLPSSRHILDDVDEVILGRGPRGAAREGRTLAITNPDRRLSRRHARLSRAQRHWAIEDLESHNGILIDGVKITERRLLRDGEVIEAGGVFLVFRGSLAAVQPDQLDLDGDRLGAPRPTLATFVAPLAHAFSSLAKIAKQPVSVVLFGPTGSGKEVVARALHELSGRPGQFVALNCGALPDTILEAILFGHRKGAYSGAVDDRPGLVRSSDRGTLFLDEIAELPAESQAAFLRVLQEREVVPVASSSCVKSTC